MCDSESKSLMLIILRISRKHLQCQNFYPLNWCQILAQLHPNPLFKQLRQRLRVRVSYTYTVKKLKKRGFNFLQAERSSKNVFFIFCKLKKLKKHEFNFCKLKKPQTWIYLIFFFFASLKKLKKHGFNFLQA